MDCRAEALTGEVSIAEFKCFAHGVNLAAQVAHKEIVGGQLQHLLAQFVHEVSQLLFVQEFCLLLAGQVFVDVAVHSAYVRALNLSQVLLQCLDHADPVAL